MVTAPSARAATQAVIVGAGPAGDAVAAGLRDGRFEGSITLVGSEPDLPYERPHLSKRFIAGKIDRDRLGLRPPQQYRDLQIELRLGERVVEIDVDQRTVRLAGGEKVAWDVLCIATGSDARRLPGLEGATYLRELPDAERVRAGIASRQPLHIVGAGFIGCEVAAVAAEAGCEVHVFEALDQPLLRVLGPELGSYLAGVHRAHGVDLRLNVASVPHLPDPLVAVGAVPRTDLAARARLSIDGGIVVDESGRTSAPGVFAAGDGTRFFSPIYERHIRVEHFQTAQRNGYAIGVGMAGHLDRPQPEVPWFWSEQYDLKLDYAGAGLPWDEIVVRGRLGHPPFTVFYLNGGELVAAAGVNDFHAVSPARRVMQRHKAVTREQLADRAFDLRRLLA